MPSIRVMTVSCMGTGVPSWVAWHGRPARGGMGISQWSRSGHLPNDDHVVLAVFLGAFGAGRIPHVPLMNDQILLSGVRLNPSATCPRRSRFSCNSGLSTHLLSP